MKTSLSSSSWALTLVCVFTVFSLQTVQGTPSPKFNTIDNHRTVSLSSTFSALSPVSSTRQEASAATTRCCFRDFCSRSTVRRICTAPGRLLKDSCRRVYSINSQCEATSITCCKRDTCPVAPGSRKKKRTLKCAVFDFQKSNLTGSTFARNDPFCGGYAVRIANRKANQCTPELEPLEFISDGTRKAISTILNAKSLAINGTDFKVSSQIESPRVSLDTFLGGTTKFIFPFERKATQIQYKRCTPGSPCKVIVEIEADKNTISEEVFNSTVRSAVIAFESQPEWKILFNRFSHSSGPSARILLPRLMRPLYCYDQNTGTHCLQHECHVY